MLYLATHIPDHRLMKIAFVVTNSDFSGAPRNVIDAARALKSHYELHLYAGGDGAIFNQQSNLFSRTMFDRELRSDFSVVNTIKSTWKLFNYIKEADVNLIWCHSFKAALISRIVAVFLRKQIIYTVHGWPWRGFAGLKLITIFVIELAATFISRPTLIFLSKTEWSGAPRIFRRFRHFVLPNTSPLGNEAYVPSPSLGRVLMIARIDRSKDHDFLFEVCGRSRFIKQLELIGAGTEKFHGKTLVNGCQVLGWGEVDDVLARVRRNDVVVLFSKFEALPISLLEAISQGRPVIATNVGSIPEIVIDGINGFIVGRDAGEAANKLDLLLGDNDVARGFSVAALEHFRNNFCREKYEEKVMTLVKHASNDV